MPRQVSVRHFGTRIQLENGMASTARDRSSAIFRLVITLISCLAILWVSLGILGVLPPINAKNPDLSAPGLTGVVFLHILYGTLLFAGIVGAGLAIFSFAPKSWKLSTADHLLLAPIFGLFSWIAVCIAVRLLNGSTWIILALEFGFIALRLHRILAVINADQQILSGVQPVKGSQTELPRLGWFKLAMIYCLGIAFSAHYGLLWRLPSEIPNGTLDLGDLAFFTGAYHSLKLGIIPFAELAIEGENFHPFNQTPQLLALGFDALPHFEISLFLTTSIAIFFFLSIAYSTRNLLRYRQQVVGFGINRGLGCVLVLLLCASVRYPSWLVETPPYALAVPMALSLIYLIDRGRERLAFLIIALPLTVITFTVTKVMVMPVIGCYAFCVLCHRAWTDKSKLTLVGIVIGGVLAATLSTILVATFWHNFISFASDANFWPTSIRRLQHHMANGTPFLKSAGKVLFLIAMDIGVLFLLGAALRLRDFAPVTSIALGAILYYAYSYLFWPTAPSCFVLMFAWLLLARRQFTFTDMLLLAISGILVIFSFFGRDVGGWPIALVWALPLGAMLVLLEHSEQAIATLPKSAWRLDISWQLAFTVACLLSAAAHADGALRLGRVDRPAVAPEIYDLWAKVRELTPPDALIFTDQTGDNEDRLGGWNDLAMMAERQFYISSSSTSYLRGDVAARVKRLASNEAILQGTVPPGTLTLRRSYGSYYAAVSASRQIPSSFQQVYTNGSFSIYRMP
jgi:hypothetical protein